jgi:hypothetical protein
MPTRWATNYLVLQSILHSRVALQLAVAADGWGQLPSSSQYGTVRELMLDAEFWSSVKMLVELLQPFSNAVHQLEGDKPHLAECHQVLGMLRKHAEDWASKHRTQGLQADEACPITGRALATIDRGLDATAEGSVAPMYNPNNPYTCSRRSTPRG